MNVHEPATDTSLQPAAQVSKTRLITGGALVIGGFLGPLLIPLVTRSDLPTQWKTILSTGLVAGLPEIGMVLAAAVLGKQGFTLLKNKLFALLHRLTTAGAGTQQKQDRKQADDTERQAEFLKDNSMCNHFPDPVQMGLCKYTCTCIRYRLD